MPDGGEKRRRVALVTVHGVGDQMPGDTARAAAKLLLTFPGANPFTSFDGGSVEVPVAKTLVNRQSIAQAKTDATMDHRSRRGIFDERAPSVRHWHESAVASQANARAGSEFEFMRDQLRDAVIQDGDATYSTLRLVGVRPARAAANGEVPTGPLELHVFEMYWADLSRLLPGLLRFFTELYLLLFFVCQLGRKALDFAQAERPHQLHWQVLRHCQAWAERIFTRFISVLEAYLLAAAVVLLPLAFTQYQPLIAVGVPAALVTVLIFCACSYRFSARQWPLLFFVSALAAAGVGAFVVWQFERQFLFIAVLLSLLAAFALVLRVMYAFSKRQPGAYGVAAFACAAMMAFFLGFSARAGTDKEGIVNATLWTAEMVWVALAVCWIVFDGLAFVTLIMGGITCLSVARRAAASQEERAHARRVVWTVLVSLAVPPLLFLILTLALWMVLALTFQSWLPVQNHVPIAPFTWFFDTTGAGSRGTNVPEFVKDLITNSAPLLFYAGFLAFLGVVAVVAWSLMPSILSDMSLNRASVGPTERAEHDSRWLGLSLSAGLRTLVVSLGLVCVLLLLSFPVMVYIEYVKPVHDHELGGLILGGVAAVILAVIAARGRVQALTLGLGHVLDIILDVANWLRYLPKEQNPRNRICARYVSLLRYLCAWRDPRDGGGYDALVIMAHSQGCVITVDLLRYLCVEPDPALGRLRKQDGSGDLPISLFTMGNPLRQFYSLPLPDIYGWVSAPTLVMNKRPKDIPERQAPHPDELLGVVHWSNAFRSGDYIGRQLWRKEDCEYLYALADEVSTDAAGARTEFCLGKGGHVHYWDDTAPEIAHELQRLLDAVMAN